MTIRGKVVSAKILAIAAMGLLSACATQIPGDEVVLPEEKSTGEMELSLHPVSYAALPGWDEDNVAETLPALRRSCEKIARKKRRCADQSAWYWGRGW